MALSFSHTDQTDDSAPIAQINTTPLVDVMLVLLIIFLITIPVVNTSIEVALPKENNAIRETRPENIVVSVDANGAVFWFDARVKNDAELAARLKAVAAMKPQPELQIRGDGRADFESVGKLIASSQRAGIERVGFITEPTQ